MPSFKVWLVLIAIYIAVDAARPKHGWTRSDSYNESDRSLGRVNNNELPDPIVVTKDGALKGFVMRTIKTRPIAAFEGIPYAQPPVGPLRFQAQKRVLPWNGVRDALTPGPQCIQLDGMPPGRIHGFQFGAGSLYGPRYLLDQDVVLVTINHRLGPFGFLSTGDDASPGNNGLKDQVLALKWVQNNIANFGGDPNSVTIYSTSYKAAGAGAVQHHIVSPASRGLFNRAITQSGSGFCWWAISENSPELAWKIGSQFNCGGTSQEVVDCLRRVDANSLAAAQTNLREWNSFPLILFGPVVEHNHPGAFLTELPQDIYKKDKAAKVPWINGFTSYEMSWLFADFIQNASAVAELNRKWDELGHIFLTVRNTTGDNSQIATQIRDFYLGRNNREIGFRNRDHIAQMLGDRFFLKCGLDGMRYHSRYTGQPVFGYEFSYEGKYSIVQLYGQDPQEWGAAHLDDTIYLLNNTMQFPTIQTEDNEEITISQVMTSAWTNFATYGTPYIGEGKTMRNIWGPIPRSTCESSPLQFLDLNLNPKTMGNPYHARYELWRRLQLTE